MRRCRHGLFFSIMKDWRSKSLSSLSRESADKEFVCVCLGVFDDWIVRRMSEFSGQNKIVGDAMGMNGRIW